MEFAHVEAFLALCEELHFGRVGERLHLSGARISQRIQELEREVGAPLFTRTSRRVELTPLGARLRERLEPAHRELTGALGEARAAARGLAGELRLGFTQTTGGPLLDELATAFTRAHPECRLTLHEVAFADPYAALRADEVDVILNWLVGDLAGLVRGPTLYLAERAVMVGRDHPLAARDAVSTDDLADYPVPRFVLPDPGGAAVRDAVLPRTSRGGRPLHTHAQNVHTLNELTARVASGQLIWPTVAPVSRYSHQDGIVFVPIEDLPPLPLGLIWRTGSPNARIAALVGLGRPADQSP